MGILTQKRAEPLQEVARRQEKLQASLPSLRERLAAATTKRDAAHDDLERAEEDALAGVISDATLTAKRAEHAAIVVEERNAAAALANANRDLGRMAATIVRLKTEANAPRCAELHSQYRPLVEAMRERLAACVEANDALHQFFLAAQAEFPDVVRPGESRGYPVAAGLISLSWPELRHNPHATNGGKLGTWLMRVADFLNPPPAPAPPSLQRSRVTIEASWRILDRLTEIIRNEGLDENNPEDKATIQRHVDRLNQEAEARAQQPAAVR